MRKYFFTFSLLYVCAIAQAQAPQQINYQGVARNAAGQPMTNQSIRVRLSIRDSSATGPVLYTETRALTTNQFGLFITAINSAGASNVTGNFTTIDWAAANKFIQVEIDPTGGTSFTDLGSTQLLSVPFALHAANGFRLPYAATLSIPADALLKLANSGTTGTEGALQATSASQAANATAIRATISSTTPGNLSSALRGINRSTNLEGIGVWGSHDGGGRGVYGTTNSGAGIYGEAITSGIGVHGRSSTGISGQFINSNASNATPTLQANSNGSNTSFNSINTGLGNAAVLNISNPASNSQVLEISTNGTGSGITVQMSNAASGARAIDITHGGNGPGLFATSVGGIAVWGITSSISAAGVIGDNTFGEAVVGRNRGGNGVGAVVGRNDSAGYGVRGFNTKTGIGVLGQAGISAGTGKAGRFENLNASNTTNVFEVSSNSTANLAVFIASGANVARINSAGRGFFNGGTQASGADVAEAFDVSGEIQDYGPGDVLVISTEKDRQVCKSTEPYSNKVAGVYATKPGMLLTEENIDANLSNKIPLGILGVIPTKVSMEGGVIRRGDLLVTSSLPGVAMKADPSRLQFGQVIGKALQEYSSPGTGLINVLVNTR